MSDYLEGYGQVDAKRERFWKRAVISVLLVIVLTATGYFLLRDYREVKQVNTFLELLKAKNYEAAYALWGCTAQKPCRDYSYETFLDDWGPKSRYVRPESAKLVKKRSCASGVIQTLDFGNGNETILFVNRSDLTLGFAPWPVCNPKMKLNQ